MGMGSVSDAIQNNRGNEFKLFLGTVTEDNDPTGAGRFKASVPGLFDKGELPWVGRIRESLFGMGNGYGTYGTPRKGSTVVMALQDGDASYAYCVGFYPKNSEVPDVFKNGRVWGYKDPSGTMLVVNPDTKTYAFTHASGTTVNIDGSGNLSSTIVGNANIEVQGGQATVKATNVKIDATDTTITGNATVEGVLTANSGLAVNGDNGSGNTATINGNIRQIGNFDQTGGHMKSNDVTVDTHTHDTPAGESDSPTPNT